MHKSTDALHKSKRKRMSCLPNSVRASIVPGRVFVLLKSGKPLDPDQAYGLQEPAPEPYFLMKSEAERAVIGREKRYP